MIKAVIIDDEQGARNYLSKLIAEFCSNVEVVATAESADEGMKVINELKPELIFLDINMPYKSGFELLEQMEEINFEVVFTTAHNEYAIKAIKFSALDYLLKPIDVSELQAAIERAKDKIMNKAFSGDKLKVFLSNLRNANNTNAQVSLPTMDGYIFMKINDIVRCEANGAYSDVHLTNGDKMIISKNLKEMDKMLSSNSFFRTHKSHLVNLNHVRRYYKGKGGTVLLSDGSSVEVSVRKKESFLQYVSQS